MKRSILKKMIVLTLAFAMVFSSVITSVSANEAELTATLTATADKESYVAGDTVVVTFAVTGEVDAIGLTYGFDAGLTFVSAEWIIADAKIADVDLEKGNAAIAFDGAAILSETAVFAMTFTADADGEYAVTATPVMKNGAANVAADTAVATVVVGASHECVFGDWQSNETSHWKACECGEVVGLEEHAYANACDALCDTCGYTREVGDHALGAYEYNDEGHWQTCGECGTKTDVAAHEYDWVVTKEATNKQAGSREGTCVCGHKVTEKIRRVLKFSTRNLALANKIAVNFKLAKEYITTEGYSNPYVMYSVGGSELQRLDYYLDDTNRPTFTIGVNPQLMTADMELYLYAEYDGELVAAEVYNFKVIDYCYSQLNGASANDTKMRTLLVDLLHYGSAVQKLAKYNTDKLANADLTETQNSWRTPISYVQSDYVDSKDNKYVIHDNPTAVYKTLALALDSAVEIKFGMQITCDDMTNVKLYATNNQIEWEIPSSEFVYDSSSGRYFVYFNVIEAHQMDDLIYFTFKDGETAISNTYRYSVESYVYSNIAKSSSSADLKLALACMMNYGRSADRCSK